MVSLAASKTIHMLEFAVAMHSKVWVYISFTQYVSTHETAAQASASVRTSDGAASGKRQERC